MNKKNLLEQIFPNIIMMRGLFLFSTVIFLGCISGSYGRKTALMIVSAKGDTEMISTLLEEGADVNTKDELGKTALMRAA